MPRTINSTDDAKTFGTRLRQLRNHADLSQQAAARHAGVSRFTWQRYEAGDMLPSTLRIPLVARALDVPIAALFTTPGTTVIADVVITDAALNRIREHGQPELEQLTKRLTDNIVPRLNAAATKTVTATNRDTQKPRARRAPDQLERLRNLNTGQSERRRGQVVAAAVT